MVPLALTGRDKALLRMLAEGKTQTEIAQAFGLRRNTSIGERLHRLREKTSTRTTVQLIAMAVREGAIE